MDADLMDAASALFLPRPAEPAAAELPTYIVDAIERQLSLAYVSIDAIASNLSLSAGEVLDALDVLERRHGVGQYLDVSSRDNTSVRLRNSVRHEWLRRMPRHARSKAVRRVEGKH
jgi:transposase